MKEFQIKEDGVLVETITRCEAEERAAQFLNRQFPGGWSKKMVTRALKAMARSKPLEREFMNG